MVQLKDWVCKVLGRLRKEPTTSEYGKQETKSEGPVPSKGKSMRVTSNECYDLMKHFEGYSSKAYKCPAGVWTIGYGHTGTVDERGMTITMEEALELLERDALIAEQAVERLIDVSLQQYQFDALVSFTMNLGQGNLERSTLRKLLNEGDYEGAANEFPKWRMSNGKPLLGLERRRAAEKLMFEGNDWRNYKTISR